MNVFLLHNDHRHGLDTHVATIDYIRICILALIILKIVGHMSGRNMPFVTVL